MIKTLGLTHIALPVKDVNKSFRFYEKLFGVKAMYRNPGFIQAQTPGSHDIIVFEKRKKSGPKMPGDFHFGFRLAKSSGITNVLKTVKAAGGKIKESGEFVPGEPYVFLYDPDGYEIEIWFEKILPTHKTFN